MVNLENMLDEELDITPILTDGQKQLNETNMPPTIPILPFRGNVLFPFVSIPIAAGRDKSIKLIEDAFRKKLLIGVVAQRSNANEPQEKDMYNVGCIVQVKNILTINDGNRVVFVDSIERFMLTKIVSDDPYWTGEYTVYPDNARQLPKNHSALTESIRDNYIKLIQMMGYTNGGNMINVRDIKDPYQLVNYVASLFDLPVSDKQKLLEMNDFTKRATKILSYLIKEVKLQEVKQQIQNKVFSDMDKQQRDYLLTQQLKTIQEELGGSPSEKAVEELKSKAKHKKWTKEVSDIFKKELHKLESMHNASPEYSVQLNYLSFMVELPWNEYSSDNFDLNKAKEVLDTDHYGLEKVKERIIEYLAVLKLKGDMKSPIICLVGPPGVGKTSLGKSIAAAIGRKYVRIALGGLSDESEIRGHRRTYIGAMPGRILTSINKAKTSNPVFVLDEIDKITGMTINGDPSSAMLEVLDPEQNTAFHDNFLDIDYDLSKVMFIATANTLSSIHPALLDRMEIIDISGYIEEEKLQIAKRHLIRKQLKEHGLKKKQITINDSVLKVLINEYTRESGVRELERTITKLIRYRAVQIAKEEKYNTTIAINELQKILGLPRAAHELQLESDTVGVVTGLAWTAVGGEILFVEASLSKGKGSINLTGNLGEVMKESATLAYQYLKANSESLGIKQDFEQYNLHIHVPEGATPKDGPSAGVTIFTAILSIFTNRKVKRNVAMTGEITLRGKVLPVGGIKEKILAAKRSKITEIILSEQNKKDIEDIPALYLEGLKFHYIKTIQEIPAIAMTK
ncbi:MAG: endopeptidase La [Bacteroidales bacterium]|jgi:ATP-dependent Lon protease|nr:endopeptidase La [Bacteroidales bacterium]